MSDWSTLGPTEPYANVLADIAGRDTDTAVMFSTGTFANIPTGAIGYDLATNRLQKWSGSAWVPLAVSLAGGGTGGTDAPTARTALGLGALATLATAPVANGGTGAVTAAAALVALGVPGNQVSAKVANFAVAAPGVVYVATGSITATLPASANGYAVPVVNAGTGVLTIARAGADLIDGYASLVLAPGETALLVGDGAGAWRNLRPREGRWLVPMTARAGNFSVDAQADQGVLQVCAASLTATLPTAAAAGAGYVAGFLLTGSGSTLTIAPSGADTINGAGGSQSLTAAYGCWWLGCDGASHWYVVAAAGVTSGDSGFAANIVDIF